MKRPLSSPRRRRRLAWGGSALFLVAAVLALGVMYRNTARSLETPPPSDPARAYREPKHVALTPEQRARAFATVASFVRTAVARARVGDSYDLVARNLRAGFTRREWAKGDIPIVPYPVAAAGWKLQYSYEHAVGVQVLLYPRRGAGLRPGLFLIELTPVGSGQRRRWLVSSWVPVGAQRPPAAQRVGVGGVGRPASNVGGRSVLGTPWLAVPLGLLALIVLVPLAVGVRGWYRSRRALRAYAGSRSAS